MAFSGQQTTEERTEQPTALRLIEARREGQVARSADLVAALTVLGMLAVLTLSMPRLLAAMTTMVSSLLGAAGADIRHGDSWTPGLEQAGAPVLGILACIALGGICVAVLANFIQVGPLATPRRLLPDFGRLSLAAGARRLLSARAGMAAAMAIAKVVAVTGVSYMTVRTALPRILSAGGLSAGAMASEAGDLAISLGLRIALALGVLAVLDFLYQRWQLRTDLMMTRREVMEDLKEMQLNPAVRRRMRRLARKRMGF